MTAHITRAQLLLEHSRFGDAEQELRRAILQDPNNGRAHSLLSLALTAQKRYPDAIREAKLGIGLSPNVAFSYYTMAVALKANRPDEARSAVQKAIRMDPEYTPYYGLLSRIDLQQQKWQDALAAAEQGLRIAPEDVECTNLRAMALVNLGRKEEAGLTIEAALAQEPDNAFTHANQGWTLLHRGDHGKAMNHFREALRLNPTSIWARRGIVEALKARNPIYRILLQYFLWMSRQSSRARWGIILGAYFAYQVVYQISASNPSLSPYLGPFLYLYMVFVFLSWTSGPLFNLLLRLNRLGRLSLSGDQIVASNWVGACVLVAAVTFITGMLPGNDAIRGTLSQAALKYLILIIPVSGVFQARAGRNRMILAAYTIALGIVGTCHLISSLVYVPISGLDTIFWVGIMLYSWVGNALITSK